MALFVREVKQVVPGPWRPQWVGSLRELFAVPRMGTLFLLGFLFQVMWSGNVAIISIYVLQLLATQLAGRAPRRSGSGRRPWASRHSVRA